MSGFTNGLPTSWELTALGEAYQVIGGGTPSTNVSDCWGGDTPWITSADIGGVRQINIRKYVTEKGIKESATNKVPPRTLLVVTRVGLGKIAIAATSICFSQDLQGLVQSPKLICPEYTLYLLSYKLQFLKFDGRGTTISGVTKKQLKDLTFPLPPLPEQHRIVAKIEELFSELDKGIENLKTARAQLKVYRQALLIHAFEGRLTAQWREENKDKLETAAALLKRIQAERAQHYQQQLIDWETSGKQGSKPKAPKFLSPLTVEELAELPELPEGWGWFLMGNICLESILGKMLDKEKNKGELKPYLRNINVRWGKFALDDLLEMRFEESEYVRYSLEDGDLVICEGGEPGRCAVWRKELSQDMQIQKALHRVRFTKSINSFFVQMYFELCASNRRLEKMFTGTTIKHLTGERLARMSIAICSIDEQDQVLSALELKFSEIDQLDQTITTSLQQAEALRQSILKKAFSGQLVPQDPHDEPAAVLLERIQTEKATSPNNRKCGK